MNELRVNRKEEEKGKKENHRRWNGLARLATEQAPCSAASGQSRLIAAAPFCRFGVQDVFVLLSTGEYRMIILEKDRTWKVEISAGFSFKEEEEESA